MGRNRLYRMNAADIFIAILVLAISISPLFSFNGQKQAASGLANIYSDNRIVEQVATGTDGIYKIKNMEVEVSKGRVRIAKSDCPRQICVHNGWISGPAQTIVCVPNKVLVEIQGGGGQYDAVSY